VKISFQTVKKSVAEPSGYDNLVNGNALFFGHEFFVSVIVFRNQEVGIFVHAVDNLRNGEQRDDYDNNADNVQIFHNDADKGPQIIPVGGAVPAAELTG